ncbi:DNRLRE domain-containing protein [Paenibacillus sp. chi10]|uniref:DNRLRE domain-containing protein n=1 Tax=Paenibacillus suaedae TaxID=3077233 RepID=A0AAJ2JVM9_9BACL|nr:DNRLRE domain-containing protein [Paenibacillus sp. chi10]MDT8975038.1 DNRLRE domain-containing protein [Paenibacillus sp. chi10]
MQEEVYDFNANLWVGYAHDDVESSMYVRHYDEPINTMAGKYVLYTGKSSDIDSYMFVYKKAYSDLNSSLIVRVQNKSELDSFAMIMYKGISDKESTIEAIAGSFVESVIEVAPNNRMYGDYELFEAPRIIQELVPVKDAFTRDSVRYQSQNWGTEKQMFVGRDTRDYVNIENFESFVEFDLHALGKEKLIEKATLRLYCADDKVEGTDLEFTTNKEFWNEIGITAANAPMPLGLITNKFLYNKQERYIEVDMTDIVLKWYRDEQPNYGIGIRSQANSYVTFFTRELGYKQPKLFVQYIDLSKSYTATRYLLDAEMFVIGRGFADLDARINVNSNIGFSWMDSSLYVHRADVPMLMDYDADIYVSRPELHSSMFVYKTAKSYRDASLTVRSLLQSSDVKTQIDATRPELHSEMIVDKNAFLQASLQTRAFVEDDPRANIESQMESNKPELGAVMEVFSYNDSFEGIIQAKPLVYDDVSAFISVPTPEQYDDKSSVMWSNRPELHSEMLIYIKGDSDLESYMEVYEHEDIETSIASSSPELVATVLAQIVTNLNSSIDVRGHSIIDSVLTVNVCKDINATIDIKAIHEVEAEMTSNRPELFGYLFRRYQADEDLVSQTTCRQRDVNDLHARFGIRSQTGGAYYFII